MMWFLFALVFRRRASVCRSALIRLPGAAVLGEKADQRVHRLVTRRINHRAAAAPHGDEASLSQPVEVERKSIRGQAERGGDFACRDPVGTGLHQQPIGVEAVFLRQRGQCVDDV